MKGWIGRAGVVKDMVRSTGFEPVTVRLEGGCSIQLSYERVLKGCLGIRVLCGMQEDWWGDEVFPSCEP